MISSSDEALLAAIVDSAEDAIISKELDGTIRSWNPGAERLFGYTRAEAIGRNIAIIIPDDRLAEEFEILARLSRGERVEHFETQRRHKDGHLVDVSLTISPVREGNRFVGASKIARDISEQRRIRDQLARESELLRRTNEELEQFIYMVSHDLQEPLQTIRGNAMKLSERASEIGIDGLIQQLSDSARSMDRLVRGLIELAQIRRQNDTMVPVDCNVALAHVRENLSTLIKDRGAEIISGALPTVPGHPLLVERLLQNLVANAIYFSTNKPHVTLFASLDHSGQRREWRFSVTNRSLTDGDAQPGFDRLGRLISDEPPSGSGLALAICHRIVEQHGGRIWTESIPGHRTTVFFTLPEQQP